MPKWYYTKKDIKENPSVIGGMDTHLEVRYRREGARFIMELGSAMNLSLQSTMATAVVFFHRFYMKHTFQDFARFPTACACLFLAGKVEETPKKCRDMIDHARRLLGEPKFSSQFGTDIRNQFEEVMTLERILLQTIKFDLQLEHPYRFLLKYAQSLKGDKVKVERMVQMAWNFVNDSLCTTLCLQWEPEIVAIALMYLACKLSKLEVSDWHGRLPEHFRWWDQYVDDMSIDVLEDICHQVLDFYSQAKPPEPGNEGTPTNTGANVPPQHRSEHSNSLAPRNGTGPKVSPHAPSPLQPAPHGHDTYSPAKLAHGVTNLRGYQTSSLPGSPSVPQAQHHHHASYHHHGRSQGPPLPGSAPSQFSVPPPSMSNYSTGGGHNGMMYPRPGVLPQFSQPPPPLPQGSNYPVAPPLPPQHHPPPPPLP